MQVTETENLNGTYTALQNAVLIAAKTHMQKESQILDS
jgi:hypothetical protein